MGKKIEEKKENNIDQIKLNFNNVLNTIWVDALNFGVREDGNVIMRFMTHLPEGHFEQCRIMTHKNNIMRWIDTLCEMSDYYPKKKRQTPPKQGDGL